MHYHSYHMIGKQQNLYDPTKRGASITDSTQALRTKGSSKQASDAGSRKDFPHLAFQSTLPAELQRRGSSFVPYVVERDPLNLLLESYMAAGIKFENSNEATKFD